MRTWDAVLGTRALQLGVMLFFLLSAFLMSALYIGRAPTADAMRRYGLARFGRWYRCSWRWSWAWLLGKVDSVALESSTTSPR